MGTTLGPAIFFHGFNQVSEVFLSPGLAVLLGCASGVAAVLLLCVVSQAMSTERPARGWQPRGHGDGSLVQ